MKSLACLLLVLAAACGTASEASPMPGAKPQSTAAPDDQALCVQAFTRARTCTDQYIPALVDARARKDRPPGVAAKVAADRDGVIAIAKQEWATDSTDDALAANCQRILAGTVDHADTEAAKGCLAQSDCSGFTACMMPIIDKHL